MRKFRLNTRKGKHKAAGANHSPRKPFTHYDAYLRPTTIISLAADAATMYGQDWPVRDAAVESTIAEVAEVAERIYFEWLEKKLIQNAEFQHSSIIIWLAAATVSKIAATWFGLDLAVADIIDPVAETVKEIFFEWFEAEAIKADVILCVEPDVAA